VQSAWAQSPLFPRYDAVLSQFPVGLFPNLLPLSLCLAANLLGARLTNSTTEFCKIRTHHTALLRFSSHPSKLNANQTIIQGKNLTLSVSCVQKRSLSFEPDGDAHAHCIKVCRQAAERYNMRVLLAASLLGLCMLAGLKPVPARSEMLVQVCFSPAGECASHLLLALDNADQEILVAMYAFTSAILARALIRAWERGVDVRVILDAGFDSRSGNSVADLLALSGVPVHKVSGMSRRNLDAGLMHQKFLVVDHATVASGSYNWTHSADTMNYESLLLFHDARSLAGEFRTEFMRLWGK